MRTSGRLWQPKCSEVQIEKSLTGQGERLYVQDRKTESTDYSIQIRAWAEKMKLRRLAVLAQDQSSGPSSHVGQLTGSVTQDPENQSPLLASADTHTHLCIHAHMHTEKINF